MKILISFCFVILSLYAANAISSQLKTELKCMNQCLSSFANYMKRCENEYDSEEAFECSNEMREELEECGSECSEEAEIAIDYKEFIGKAIEEAKRSKGSFKYHAQRCQEICKTYEREHLITAMESKKCMIACSTDSGIQDLDLK